MAASICVLENRGVYGLASGPVMSLLWGQLFAARRWALQRRIPRSPTADSPPCPSAGGVVLSSREVADAMSWLKRTCFDCESREQVQQERDRQSGLKAHQVRQRSQSRFHVALYQRYGGDLLSRIVVARGEVSEETLTAMNRVAWDRHVAGGSVRTRGPAVPSETLDAATAESAMPQRRRNKSRAYSEAMGLRKEAKLLLNAAKTNKWDEDLQHRARIAMEQADEAACAFINI